MSRYILYINIFYEELGPKRQLYLYSLVLELFLFYYIDLSDSTLPTQQQGRIQSKSEGGAVDNGGVFSSTEISKVSSS